MDAVVAPNGEGIGTCWNSRTAGPSHMDYFVVSKRLAPAVTVCCDFTVPRRPHTGIRAGIQKTPRRIERLAQVRPADLSSFRRLNGMKGPQMHWADARQ